MRATLSDRDSSSLGAAIPCGGRRRWLISTLVAVPALVSLIACSSGAPSAPSQPTVQAAATQISAAASPAIATVQAAAPTVQAAAQAAAPTIQAAASPVTATAAVLAGTAVARGEAAATAFASPSPSPSPAALAPAPVRIADASLADATPWVSLQNTSTAPVDVGGWHLEVGNQSATLPDDGVIEPGTTLTLHAGDGPSTDREIYLGSTGEALVSAARPGALVRLTDAAGQVEAQTTVPSAL
jgi:hypothetical protein